MNGHLPVLIAMFPGKTFLDVNDIATCLCLSKAHIYRLSSDKRLPFKVNDLTDRILVSVLEMANYLDSKLNVTSNVEGPKEEESKNIEAPVHTLIVKKRGRPRGMSRKQSSFQSSLAMAIMKVEIEIVFHEMQRSIDELSFPDNDRKCSEKFDDAKDEFGVSLMRAQRYLSASFMELGLSRKSDNVGKAGIRDKLKI